MIIDGDDGLEIREKLLNILALVLEAPDNLIHLKNLTGSIIKINESQDDLLEKNTQIINQTRQAKRTIREKQKSLTALNKEIDVHEKEVNRKINDRQEEIDMLKYVRDTIEMIHDLQHHSILIKELRPQRKSHDEDIKGIKSRMIRLNTLLESCENTFEHLELEMAELEKIFDQDKKALSERMNTLGDEEETTKKELDENEENKASIIEEMSNGSVYIEQLEKQVISKKKEIEILNEDKTPLVEVLQSDRQKMINEFDGQIKKLDKEEDQKISESKRSKSVTIEAYFKKEITELEKKGRAIDSSLKKAKKDKDRAKTEREKAHSSLTENKKKNMPKIADLNKQINEWQKDLNQGRRFQDRLDVLEEQKREWDEQLYNERKNINDQIATLNDTIERKRSNSYILFLKDGLNRFKNSGDANEIARSMAEESISMDMDEIKKLEKDLENFIGRYESFMTRYRKSHRNVLVKLRPYGGRKKTIVLKMQKAKEKVQKLESMIRSYVNKVDEKNEYLIDKQNIFNEISEHVKTSRSDIKYEIQNIPNKKKRAKSDIDRRLKERLGRISDKRSALNDEKNKSLQLLDNAFVKKDLIVKISAAEDKMIFYFNEIEKTKEKIQLLLQEEKRLSRSGSLLEVRLEKIFKKHDQNQITVSRKEEKFKDKKINLTKKTESNRSEFSILQEIGRAHV